MSTQPLPSSFIKKASDIASFYGFRHAQSLDRELPKESRLAISGSRDADRVAEACVTCMVSRSQKATAAAAAVAAEKNEKPQQTRAQDAMLCYFTNPTPSEAPHGINPRDVAEFGVSIVGSSGSIGEIVALKTLFSILADSGARVRGVRIGSGGDRDSQMRFSRELSAYLKKRSADIPDCCSESMAQDPLSMMRCAGEVCSKIIDEGPRAMGFLSEKSRSHFREVLEYLERAGMTYELDERLVHDPRMPRVLFSLDIENEDHLIVGARGGRYDDHLRKLSGRKDATVVRASVFFKKKGLERSAFTYDDREKRAKIYFVKLGLEASLKSLTVLDSLRKARIPVYQSFSADKLGPQLSEAERLKVPYLIIMGQREAMQDAVIVRRVETRSQQMVRLIDLPLYLKAV